MLRPATYACLASVLLVACEGRKTGTAEPPPRVPVTVSTLELSEPARDGRRMGVAQAYRAEEISFEVSGRVMMVRDVGEELVGPVLGAGDRLVKAGDVIARVDPSRYAQRVSSLESRIAAEQAELEAKRIDTNKVAQAQADLAKVTYERQQRLAKAGTASKEDLDQAKANFDVAEATLELKKAQLIAQEARIKELDQELRSAKLDLEDCVLRAPYSGRITERHTSRGAFAQAGTPAVTVTLNDPMKIDLTLSADDERRLATGSPARIFPLGAPPDVSLMGRIRGKGQVADPRTRTFLVEVMTRNVRYDISSPLGNLERMIPLLHRYHGEEGPLFAAQDAIVSEGGKHYLFVVPREEVFRATPKKSFTPEKVEVELGKEHWTILDWHLREVRAEGLEDQDFVVRAPDANVETVDTTMKQWLIRPGDLVSVSFELGTLPKGFYVPVTAVKELNGKTWVFLVEDGKAKRVEVSAHESFRYTRRVEGEGLSEGAQLVLKGVHYLADGAPVNVQAATP